MGDKNIKLKSILWTLCKKLDNEMDIVLDRDFLNIVYSNIDDSDKIYLETMLDDDPFSEIFINVYDPISIQLKENFS